KLASSVAARTSARRSFARRRLARDNADGRAEDAALGQDGHDGLDASPGGPLHEGRGDDREDARVEESLAKGSRLRDADAHVFHQSRWSRPFEDAARRARAREEAAVGAREAGAGARLAGVDGHVLRDDVEPGQPGLEPDLGAARVGEAVHLALVPRPRAAAAHAAA